jgi:hypothetical protein
MGFGFGFKIGHLCQKYVDLPFTPSCNQVEPGLDVAMSIGWAPESCC